MKQFIVVARKKDVDELGHVSFTRPLLWSKKAHLHLLSSLGFNTKVLAKTYRAKFVVRHMSVDYYRQLFSGETFFVSSTISLGKTSVTWKNYIYRHKTLVFEATIATVFVDKKTGKKKVLPPTLRKSLSSL